MHPGVKTTRGLGEHPRAPGVRQRLLRSVGLLRPSFPFFFCILKVYLEPSLDPAVQNANSCNFLTGLKILIRRVKYIYIDLELDRCRSIYLDL